VTHPHLYVARELTAAALDRLRAEAPGEVVVGEIEPPKRDDLLARAAGACALVTTRTERVDAELLAAAGPDLRVVANVAVGFDNIDVAAAAGRGVVVTNTPGVLDRATADHTFALILDVSRRVTEGDRLLRRRTPWVWGPTMFLGLDLSAGATLGIIGYGRIGRAVARRASAFDMDVVAYDAGLGTGAADDGTPLLELDELLGRSDVVSLHCPLLPSTRHLMNAERIARMRPGSVLVNTARGGIVDESALIAALRSGHLRGAGLDVFEGEPQVNPALFDLENVVVTPHTASAGEATREAMCRLAVDNVLAVLGGREPLTPVRPA
jgi:lactate dehydrogenase-like 2-hydroxyacid dehydrogenase